MRIFTKKQLQEREIPTVEDFSILMEQIREELYVNRELFPAAQFYGSTITRKDDVDIFSDIDLLVIYHHRKRLDGIKVIENWYQYAKDMNVPLEVLPINTSDARSGLHSVNWTLYHELELAETVAPRSVVGEKPRRILSMRYRSKKFDRETYFSGRIAKLNKLLPQMETLSEEALIDFLGSVMRMPAQVMRNLLFHTGTRTYLGNLEALQLTYEKRLRDWEETVSLEKIMYAISEYKRTITEMVRSRTFQELIYQQQLNRLKEITWEVEKFIRQNKKVLERVLEVREKAH